MSRVVDLSHAFEDGMPGFTMRAANRRSEAYTARIRPLLTHAASRAFYDGKASFEVTESTFPASIGTYLDAPRHRFEGRRDIADLGLDELVLPGVVVDVCDPGRPARSQLPGRDHHPRLRRGAGLKGRRGAVSIRNPAEAMP